MKVKSFCAGLANGIDAAFQRLDEQVEKYFGKKKVVIVNVTDNVYYQPEITKHNKVSSGLPMAIRVVTYK